MMSTVIFFDLDDTLFDTVSALTHQLKTLFNQDYPPNPFAPGYKVSPELYKLVGECSNMAISKLYPEFTDLGQWMTTMREHYGVQFGVCTHRGFSPLGAIYSRQRFKELGLVWDYEYFITSEEHPSKIDYLNSQHPDSNWVLIDDRPLRDSALVPKNCLVLDQVWNQHLQTESQQRVTPATALETIESYIKASICC